jgi:hypothetical protein
MLLLAHTCTHFGPETRTTAIAARPGAVDRAYIVESASRKVRAGEEAENRRFCSVDGETAKAGLCKRGLFQTTAEYGLCHDSRNRTTLGRLRK